MFEKRATPPASDRSASRRADSPHERGESVASVVEDVVGCKWTLQILEQIRLGVVRPGALQHSVQGLTTKVLHQRLRKLVRYGLLEKQTYAERTLHVEYHLTPFGQRVNAILDQIDELQRECDAHGPASPQRRRVEKASYSGDHDGRR